jgi:hypothetical protein
MRILLNITQGQRIMRNDDLSSLLRNEYIRYANKGLSGIIGAFFIACVFVIGVPQFWNVYWPKILEFRDHIGLENWVFMVLLTTVWHAAWVLIANVAFAVIYYLEIPFIEKYKINPNPWPWKKSEQEQA